jgi:hypothetical protein
LTRSKRGDERKMRSCRGILLDVQTSKPSQGAHFRLRVALRSARHNGKG